MRVLVTGGREYANRASVEAALFPFPADAVLIHGAAPGADSLCAEVWAEMGRLREPHPAPWAADCRPTCKPGHRRPRPDGSDYCPAAGVYRNQEMLDSGVDVLVAFPGGRGTADMTARAERAGLPVVRVSE